MSTLAAVDKKDNIVREKADTSASNYDEINPMVTGILNNFGKALYGKSLFFSKWPQGELEVSRYT